MNIAVWFKTSDSAKSNRPNYFYHLIFDFRRLAKCLSEKQTSQHLTLDTLVMDRY